MHEFRPAYSRMMRCMGIQNDMSQRKMEVATNQSLGQLIFYYCDSLKTWCLNVNTHRQHSGDLSVTRRFRPRRHFILELNAGERWACGPRQAPAPSRWRGGVCAVRVPNGTSCLGEMAPQGPLNHCPARDETRTPGDNSKQQPLTEMSSQ